MAKELNYKDFTEIREKFIKEVNDLLDPRDFENVLRAATLAGEINLLAEKDMSMTFSIANGIPRVEAKGCRAAIAFGCMQILEGCFNGDGLGILLDLMLLEKLGLFETTRISKHFEIPEQMEVYKAALNNPEVMEKVIKHMTEKG